MYLCPPFVIDEEDSNQESVRKPGGFPVAELTNRGVCGSTPTARDFEFPLPRTKIELRSFSEKFSRVARSVMSDGGRNERTVQKEKVGAEDFLEGGFFEEEVVRFWGLVSIPAEVVGDCAGRRRTM
ncbi:MAG: hypothetical protein M1312_02015 [Patescibacteria group bacterium]|nr:hypothetical protein [Patescibacteria group bacterium]